MPFTVNVGPYVGGQLMAQGLSNLGQGVGEGIAAIGADIKKAQEEQGADQVLLNFYQKNGMVTPEIMNDYIRGSHTAKTSIIGGLTRQFALTQTQKEEEDRQQRLKIAQAAEDRQKAEFNWTPPQEAIDAAAKAGTPYLPIGPGKYALRQAPGAAGSRSDKVMMTITGPDGEPTQVPVTGNYFAKAMTDPVQFKKTYNVTQAQFSDPTQTQFGDVDPVTGEFIQSNNGAYVRYGVHTDPKSQTQVIGGVIPRDEWQRANMHASKAAKAVVMPQTETANPSPTATPPRGTVKASGRVTVEKDGKRFTVPAEQLDDAIAAGYKKL